MEEQQARQEDIQEIAKMNIKQFIEATRQYLFASTALPATQLIAQTPQVG